MAKMISVGQPAYRLHNLPPSTARWQNTYLCILTETAGGDGGVGRAEGEWGWGWGQGAGCRVYGMIRRKGVSAVWTEQGRGRGRWGV